MHRASSGVLHRQVHGMHLLLRGNHAPPADDPRDVLTAATLQWVDWFNEQRLHRHCSDVPPAEYEAAFCAAQQPTRAGVGDQ